MYHLRLKGSHCECGTKRGEIFNKINIKFPINLDAFQKDFGQKSIKKLEEFFPEVCEEVKGITDVTGYGYTEFLSWMMCMGCCMYNLEQNVPKIEVRGCTAFAFTHNGNVYYGRDNDLPPFLKSGSKSELYNLSKGNKFIINTSSFVNGEEGVNCHGLAVAMTFVLTELRDIQAGINSVFLVRYILEKCRTVQEGLTALQKLPIASCCNILLADSGDMAVAECSPHEINIRKSESLKSGEKFICTVNHFTSDKMAKYDASKQNSLHSAERYMTVVNAFKNNLSPQNPIEFAKEILSGKLGFMCQYKKQLNFGTIWSSIFDINNKTVYLAEGDPRRTKYKEDKRLTK